jgi:rhodanese-related sulfurtransferase
MSKVLRVPAAGQAEAVAHFATRLALETDVSDVAADLGEGFIGLVVADSRSRESWDQGHVVGAIHLPTDEIAARAADRHRPAVPVVPRPHGHQAAPSDGRSRRHGRPAGRLVSAQHVADNLAGRQRRNLNGVTS